MTMSFQGFLDKVNNWHLRNINNKTFLILVAIVVGLVAGLAAIVLKIVVHNIQHLLQTILENPSFNFLLFIFPLIGILLTVFYVQRFRKGKIGRGVSSILISIAKRSSNIDRDKTYSHMITSALTVGFGGSAGLEAPIVVTGAAIGSVSARDLKMNYRERTLMLACGVAAGISAIFNSPIAGVLFAVEVILVEFSLPAFVPLLIASATASVLSNLLYKDQLFFLITKGWHMKAIPFYVLLGILMAFISVYVTRVAGFVEGQFKSKKRPYFKAVTGGIVLGVMIFILPPLYGEGYYSIRNLLSGNYEHLLDNSLFSGLSDSAWFIILIATIIVFVKIIATSITIGAGGNGGIFAPSLFIGAMTGFIFAYALNLTGLVELTIPNFIVAAMAGALSGVMHAPLTAIFLIAEITGGYVLFVPLMIVSSISFLITKYFEPYSIYMKKLVEKGLHTKDRDRTVLNRIKLKSILETDFISVIPSDTLGQLVDKIEHSKRNIFPVLDEDGHLQGVISLDNIREVMFHHEQYDKIYVKDLMTKPPCILDINEEMHDVMKKFDVYNSWNLPVTEANKYIGFVSKSTIFTRYRSLLIRQSEQIYS
ncbi:MAG TPA: chloride channel protein [Bacteroidia bacterium]|nr:chloride channel protein [Bacteroidia bacterium]